MSSWFYVDAGQNRQGPVSAEALVEAFRLGQVGLDSLAWREGLSEWTPLRQFRDELGLGAVAPASPPPAPLTYIAAEPAKKGNGCLIAAAVIIGGVFLLMVLGILAAIALPAYQDYIGRSKLAVVHMQGQAAKLAVQEFKANTDRCPRDADELGLPTPATEGLDALAVGSLDDGRCAVEITVGNLGNVTSAAGGRLLMALEEDGTWTCSGEGIPDKLLPPGCR